MGDYVDDITYNRIIRSMYGPVWKDKRPEEKLKHGAIVKCIRLESYEDALFNLERSKTQGDLLAGLDDPIQRISKLQEEYLLRYMLDTDTKGSPSRLNLDRFANPFAYKLDISRNGKTEPTTVDLIETFNYLIGLRVTTMERPRRYEAAFERIEQKNGEEARNRLVVQNRLRPSKDGPWAFRQISGVLPDGRTRALIIWRTLTGNAEQDNAVLDEWFLRNSYAVRDAQDFGVVYVNGSNNLENLPWVREAAGTGEETRMAAAAEMAEDALAGTDREAEVETATAAASPFRVRLIEAEFFRRMFDMGDVL
jgi:adenine-specific DNA-methyltransferase